MKTLASSEVQLRFGEVLNQARQEPVTVTRYGRPVAVMMAYEEATEARRLLATQKLLSFLEKLPLNPQAEALDEADIKRLTLGPYA